MESLLLGIDVGTGGSKALLIDPSGVVRASVTTDYPLSTPRPLWSEQDPADWWNATIASIRKALDEAGASPDAISAVCLTGQMHGLVLLDARGEVLRPAMLWNDQRTHAECEAIHERVGRENVLRITGKPALPSFTAPKVQWVRKHEPDVFERAAHLLLPKDYVRYRLTGAFAMDVADASGTSLFDVGARRWSDEMIDALDVPRSWLPEIYESPEVCGHVNADGAEATGLPAGLPVVAGAGDQAAEAIGCGIVGPGEVSVTVGTSGVVFAATDGYAPDPTGLLHAYCHAAPGAWHVMGVMLSAGGSLRWFRDTLCQDLLEVARATDVDPYELITEAASRAPVGCEGLVFLPYLTGERTPHADPHARGAFVGLTLRHGRAHMARAVMEGVTFGLLDCLSLVRAIGANPSRIRISGGGARSPVWRQMMADVFGAPVVMVNVTQGAAYGAALLAGVGADVFDSVESAVAATVREMEETMPGADASQYADSYKAFRALYPSLTPRFRELSNLHATD